MVHSSLVHKGKKYHYYEPPVLDDSLPARVLNVISNNNNNNNNRSLPSKPAFAVNAQAAPATQAGLFSTYETEAIRQSRKETYLIANMERKLKALEERERVREELEMRSRAEQQRLAEADRRRALMIMHRQQDAYIQQQQILLMQQQQALAAQQNGNLQIQFANAQAHRRGRGYGQYQETEGMGYGSPTTDEGGYGDSEGEGSPLSSHYMHEQQQRPPEQHRSQQLHVNAQLMEHNRLRREDVDRQKEALRQAGAAAIIREKIKQREEANARYVQEKAAVEAASNHRELLNFKKKHVLHESGGRVNEEGSVRHIAPPLSEGQRQRHHPGQHSSQEHGHSPKKPNTTKPSKAGGRAGAAGARGRGGANVAGHAKNRHNRNAPSPNNHNYSNGNYDPNISSDKYTGQRYVGDTAHAPRGNQYNHDGIVFDLGQGESSVAIGINEDGSVVISNHSKDDTFMNQQFSREVVKANSKVLPDVSEYRDGEKGYEGVSEYNSLIDYALPAGISASAGELGPMDEAPDDVLNAPPGGGFRKHDSKNAANAPHSQGSHGITLLGMVGSLEEEGSSVQITDWNLDGDDYD